MRVNVLQAQLWWPAWGKPVAFTHVNKDTIGCRLTFGGDRYEFTADKYEDCLYIPKEAQPPESNPSVQLMPWSDVRLVHCEKGELDWTSFVYCGEGKIQVNKKNVQTNGYSIDIYPATDLFFEGDTFELDED